MPTCIVQYYSLSNYIATLHLVLGALTVGPRKLFISVMSNSVEKYKNIVTM